MKELVPSMTLPIKRVQWGTQIEVRTSLKSPQQEIQKGAPINFSMLYLNQCSDLDEKEIPDHIIVKYSTDYNILEIDLIIKKRFESMKKKSIDQLMAKITGEEIKLSRLQSGVERKASTALKEKWGKEVRELQNDEARDRYVIQSALLVEKYKKLGFKRKIVDFTSTVKEELSDDDDVRQEIISRYLEIARRYIEIDVIRIVDDDHCCPGCGMSDEEISIDDAGIQCCPNCGIEHFFINNKANLNSDQEPQSNSRNNYSNAETFFKGLLRFQGKQTNRLPLNLMPKLDEYFSRLGLPIGDDIKKLDLLEDGTKSGTSLRMMEKALREKGSADCYEDLNLICHLYWGWKLPDISHLEEIIMDDYNKTQKVFECMKKGKKSSLNGEYRRFKHLELRWDKCKAEMFRILATRESIEKTEVLWEQMCLGAGLRFIPTI